MSSKAKTKERKNWKEEEENNDWKKRIYGEIVTRAEDKKK